MLARWIDLYSFEVTDLNLDEPSIAVPVDNHALGVLAVSPDGQRFAYLRRDNPDDGGRLRIIAADRSGDQLAALPIQLLYPTAPLTWLDDSTLLLGSARIDIGDGPAALKLNGPDIQNGRSLQSAQRIIVGVPGERIVVDNLTGEVSPVRLDINTGATLALPQPIAGVTGGFVPPPLATLPLAGQRVPASLKELVAQVAAYPNRHHGLLEELEALLVEPVDEPETAAIDDAENAGIGGASAPTPTGGFSTTLIGVGLLAAALAAAFVWTRRDSG